MVKSVAGAWPNNMIRRLKLPVALGWGGLSGVFGTETSTKQIVVVRERKNVANFPQGL
jgi:hypothetical protein